MLVRIANREDPHQTAPSEAVLFGSPLFVYAFLSFLWVPSFIHSINTLLKDGGKVIYTGLVVLLCFVILSLSTVFFIQLLAHLS